MSQDERYKKAVHEFYGAYRELQKRMNLRMASHFSMYTDNYIEIWEYRGEVKGRLVPKVKTQKGEEDTDAECYEKAADLIKNILREKKGEQHGRVYADHAG